MLTDDVTRFGTVGVLGRHKISGDLRALKMLAAVLGTPSMLANLE